MKFKSRLPMTSKQTPEETVLEELHATEVPEGYEAAHEVPQGATHESAPSVGEPLVGAFDAVARVVQEEMKSLRRDMISRIEALRQSQQKALDDFTEQTRGSLASLKEQVQKAREHANDRSDEVRKGLQQILADKEQKLERDLDTLTRNLSGVKGDLRQQIETSGQVSSLLNNMASVFASQQSLPNGSQQQQPHPATENPVPSK